MTNAISRVIGTSVRDKEVNNFLLKNNFKVIRLWEHEIDKNENNCLGNLVEEIKSCSR
jgi:very-short-patch-repair endonuclease